MFQNEIPLIAKIMMSEYKNNHYVPKWYQKRFVPDPKNQHKIFYLDLKPPMIVDSKGRIYCPKPFNERGYDSCFSEDDLYTRNINGIAHREIEEIFFGAVDTLGREAVEWCSNFSYPWDGVEHLDNLLMYMTTQKLRTPKGLTWLNNLIKVSRGVSNKNALLKLLTEFRYLFGSIWKECVWLIADASKSDTKFLISDHPVTIYNRRCGPRSEWCREVNDPDIRFNGSHTIFPLSLNKILFLTNLSWVRNPYQKEVGFRPNPNYFHPSVKMIHEIQTLRYLSEEEVCQINFIIKSRAHRYVAAAKEEWLFPEKHVPKSDWANFGHGYLFMPDPRGVTYGGNMMFGNGSRLIAAFDEYGRQPGQPGFTNSENSAPKRDWFTFHRFQGEFARLFGPYRRGRCFSINRLENEKDTDDYHQYHLNLEKTNPRH